METKEVIRKQLLNKRNLLSGQERSFSEEIILQKVIGTKEFQFSDTILFYVSYRSEVSTHKLLEYSFLMNKKVYCPKVISDSNMEFYRITCVDDLKKGYQQIPEPPVSELFFNEKKALMILPIVGFDERKNRLGYGKGYYDRYLQKNMEIIKMGIAFECQKWENGIPYENTDIPLDIIITETECYGIG